MTLHPFIKRTLLLTAVALPCGPAWSQTEPTAVADVAAADTVSVDDCDDSCTLHRVASLTGCTSIDEDITRRSRKALLSGLKHFKGSYGQLAVVDAATGELKSWVSLKLEGKHYADAPLQVKATNVIDMQLCTFAAYLHTAGLQLTDSVDLENGIYSLPDGGILRDHNWRSGGYGRVTWLHAFTHASRIAPYRLLEQVGGKEKAAYLWAMLRRHSMDEGNAMGLASMANSLFSHGCKLTPSLTGGAPTRLSFEGPLDAQGLSDVRAVLRGCFAEGGLYAPYAPKSVPMAGYFGRDVVASDDEQAPAPVVLTSRSFMGTFPADHPRYAVGLIIDRTFAPVPSARELMRQVVNPLAEWLVRQPVKH